MFKGTKRIAAVMIFAVFAALALSGCMPMGGGDGIDAGTGEASTAGGMMSFLPLILIVVVFYFILIRPQNKKNKQVQQMRSALKRGDRVTTIGGFIGRVVRIREEVITIEVGSDKTKLDIMRWGISKIDDQNPIPKGSKEKADEEPAEDKPAKQKPKKLSAPKKDKEDEDDDKDEDGDE